jgi:hypothetical protein
MALTTKKIEEAFAKVGFSNDNLRKKGNGWIVRQGFYYTFSGSSENLAKRVNEAIIKSGLKLVVKEHGQQWKPFRGGDSVSQGSHWWVTFEEGAMK